MNIAQNIYDSYMKCRDNHIYIDGLSDKVININNKKNITHKTTIFVNNCHNLTLESKIKFNNMVIINCENIKFIINNGLINGINIFHSKNISCVINFHEIYNITCSNTDNDIIQIDSSINMSNILISTVNSYQTTFKLVNSNPNEVIEYKTNMSFFNPLTFYLINQNQTINYVNVYGSGSLNIQT